MHASCFICAPPLQTRFTSRLSIRARRPRRSTTTRASLSGDARREGENRPDWQNIDWLNADVTAEDEETLRARVPRPVADFLLRRARAQPRRDDSILAKLERDGTDDFADYVYDTIPVSPALLDDEVEAVDEEGETRTEPRSLFVPELSGRDAEARKVGYGALALLVLLAVLRIAAAVVSFFVKFTFSFAAIFALSAGIFVVIVLFRFF